MIRLMNEEDIDKVKELLVQVNMVHHKGRPDIFKGPANKYSKEELLQRIKDEKNPVFVSVNEEGTVEGYAFCESHQIEGDSIRTDIKTLYIDDLCVDENLRGVGVGKSLYKHVLDYGRREGFYNLSLNVWAFNQNALAFYEKCGLKPQRTVMETVL